MPPMPERLALAERALTALVRDAELPPKIGVHPRPEGSFAHAMPAALRPIAAGEELFFTYSQYAQEKFGLLQPPAHEA